MNFPAPHVLLARPDTPADQALQHVLTAVAGGDLTVWPVQGLPFSRLAALAEVEVFWLAPSAPSLHVVQFNPVRVEDEKARFRFPALSAWVWFLGRHAPGAAVRMIDPHAVQEVLGSRGQIDQPPFTPAWLHQLLHNLRSCQELPCQHAARWLGGLDDEGGDKEFEPFTWFDQSRKWVEWEHGEPHSPVRNRLARLFPEDRAEEIKTLNALQAFYALCGLALTNALAGTDGTVTENTWRNSNAKRIR